MNPNNKMAWLIGLYTNEIQASIERLGYRLSRFYPHLNSIKTDERPSLIVFSEDEFTDTDGMFALKDLYPEAVMITLPAGISREKHAEVISVTRLVSDIQHREYRWDN